MACNARFQQVRFGHAVLRGGEQSGSVWFLAGTYGPRRTIRTCRVPHGKYLFFPVVNYVVMPQPNHKTTCRSVRNTAAAVTDAPSALVLEIDGERVGKLAGHRQATRDCFDMGARAEPRVRVFPSAANGYYVMLRPLPAGEHTINFGGVLPSFTQALTYTLIVE